MALNEAELAALTATVAARITGTVLGREASRAGTTEMEIAGASVIFVYDVAPSAPAAILREAAIRLAGWSYANRPHVTEHTVKDQSGTEISLKFNNSAATANGFRSSGASAMLARYVVRRAGAIGGTVASVEVTPAQDAGLTVMRAGFSRAIPHGQSTWRWVGTVNSIELDTIFTQPASFALWLPGDLMSRVVEIVLLRTIFAGTPGDPVNLAAFGPPEDYTFGNTDGMAISTPVTFVGQFSWPNDIRAILGEPR